MQTNVQNTLEVALNLAKKGVTQKTIAAALNKNNYPSLSSKRPWDDKMVSRLLLENGYRTAPPRKKNCTTKFKAKHEITNIKDRIELSLVEQIMKANLPDTKKKDLLYTLVK